MTSATPITPEMVRCLCVYLMPLAATSPQQQPVECLILYYPHRRTTRMATIQIALEYASASSLVMGDETRDRS